MFSAPGWSMNARLQLLVGHRSLRCSSFSVLVKNLNGKNHQMNIFNLLHPIDPKDSFKKVKLCMFGTNWMFHFCLSHL